jgi:small subunit ribosomal protein MRP21
VNFGQSIDVKPMARPQIRAKPVTGRTVFIKERISVTSAPTPAIAFRMLGKMLREQNVKNKFFLQRFHERKGLKRKRLASLRWRSRFKTGFKHTVNRVLELKRQGW